MRVYISKYGKVQSRKRPNGEYFTYLRRFLSLSINLSFRPLLPSRYLQTS